MKLTYDECLEYINFGLKGNLTPSGKKQTVAHGLRGLDQTPFSIKTGYISTKIGKIKKLPEYGKKDTIQKVLALCKKYGYDVTLEHNPTIESLSKEILAGKNIQSVLDSMKHCIILKDENWELNKKGFRKERPSDAYKICGINIEGV